MIDSAWAQLGAKIFSLLETVWKPSNITFRRLNAKVKVASKIEIVRRMTEDLRRESSPTNNTAKKIKILTDKEFALWDKYKKI